MNFLYVFFPCVFFTLLFTRSFGINVILGAESSYCILTFFLARRWWRGIAQLLKASLTTKNIDLIFTIIYSTLSSLELSRVRGLFLFSKKVFKHKFNFFKSYEITVLILSYDLFVYVELFIYNHLKLLCIKLFLFFSTIDNISNDISFLKFC